MGAAFRLGRVFPAPVRVLVGSSHIVRRRFGSSVLLAGDCQVSEVERAPDFQYARSTQTNEYEEIVLRKTRLTRMALPASLAIGALAFGAPLAAAYPIAQDSQHMHHHQQHNTTNNTSDDQNSIDSQLQQQSSSQDSRHSNSNHGMAQQHQSNVDGHQHKGHRATSNGAVDQQNQQDQHQNSSDNHARPGHGKGVGGAIDQQQRSNNQQQDSNQQQNDQQSDGPRNIQLPYACSQWGCYDDGR